MSDWQILLAFAGLTAITAITRSMFFLSRREPVLPERVRRGLRYAPLAALSAVVVPELLLTQGHVIQTWQDPRLFAAAAGAGYYFWRRGLLGTILVGMAVLLALRWWWG